MSPRARTRADALLQGGIPQRNNSLLHAKDRRTCDAGQPLRSARISNEREQKADPARKWAAIAFVAVGAFMLLVNFIAARSPKDLGVHSDAISGTGLILLGLSLYRDHQKAVKKP